MRLRLQLRLRLKLRLAYSEFGVRRLETRGLDMTESVTVRCHDANRDGTAEERGTAISEGVICVKGGWLTLGESVSTYISLVVSFSYYSPLIS